VEQRPVIPRHGVRTTPGVRLSFPTDLEIARNAAAKPLPEIASLMGTATSSPYGLSWPRSAFGDRRALTGRRPSTSW
jgi:hypothetical protein